MDIMRQSAYLVIRVKKKAKIRNQHSQVSHVNRDTTRESDKKVSEYDQEIPQSQIADNPMALRGRATQPSTLDHMPSLKL